MREHRVSTPDYELVAREAHQWVARDGAAWVFAFVEMVPRSPAARRVGRLRSALLTREGDE